jgi:hypothetical protein
MRVGAAQDLMTDGVGLLPIMRAGGWKSTNIIGRYVEHTEIALLGQMRRSIGSRVSHSRRVTDPRYDPASTGHLSAQFGPD